MGDWPNQLADFTDVDSTIIADGLVPVWNATAGQWVPSSAPQPQSGLAPTGVVYENFERLTATMQSQTVTARAVRMNSIWLPAGFAVTALSMLSYITALTVAGTGAHMWMALYDSSRNVLRQSTDDTSPVWAASTMKTCTLSSSFTTTYTGMHYVGLYLDPGSTGTMPSLVGVNTGLQTLRDLTPMLSFVSSTTNEGATATSPVGGPGSSQPTNWVGVS